MDRLPLEVLLEIFSYLSLSSFEALYQVFDRAIVNEALVHKLRCSKTKPLLNLVSTNLHELAAMTANKRNESYLSLYFACFDPIHQLVWTLPDFSGASHYFRVKDAYVSHGKLVIQPHDPQYDQQKVLVSLWDIRKSFPPTRAGTFSGASEYAHIQSQEWTLHQSGCILDSCLIPQHNAIHTETIQCNIKSMDISTKETSVKRPALPSHYLRQTPKNQTKHSLNSPYYVPVYPDPTCGYFMVERLALTIPTLLELFQSR
ncbi:hypothetical protein EDC96DRAFT_496558 [Choanephora cucurbitarum]|nr:hypothetical protein EDC96DRAFT_496558 [Choanephora cucurbitarum]